MKKKILSLVLVLALLPTAVFAEDPVEHAEDDPTHEVEWVSDGKTGCHQHCKAENCNQNGLTTTTQAHIVDSTAGWTDGTGDNAGKRVQTCANCHAEINAHTCAVGSDTSWAAGTGDNADKRVQTCGTCGAEINAHNCDTTGADGACSVCGYKAPAGDVELTVTAGATAAQEGSTPKIKTSVTIDPGKAMEASALKSAVRVTASVGSDAKAQNLVVTLPNGSTETGTAHTFEASFTMPGEAADVTGETTVTLKVTPAQGYTLAGAAGNGTLTLTTKLSSYTKGTGGEDPAPAAALRSLSMTGPTTAKLVVDLANVAEDATLAAHLFASTNVSQAAATAEAAVTSGASTATFTFTGVSAGNYFFRVFLGENVIGQDDISGAPHKLAYHAPEKPTAPTTPEKPKDENKTPGTNSQGIPVASEVTTAKQADAAVRILKNTDAQVLQDRLMRSDSALSSFRSLERAVMSAKRVSVSVETDRNAVPSAVRSGVDIDGAAFNASSSSVKLVVDAPSRAYGYSTGYQISMRLTGVWDSASLDVPVIITLPLPRDVSAGRVVVLHYHSSGANPTVIFPAVSGNEIRFPVTGFSDFVVTRDDEYEVSPSVGAVVPRSSRNSNSTLDAVLPAIAAALSHDLDGVFADVPGTHWAAKEIRWARNGGLMAGYENGNFRPWAPATRQELWMVLGRLAGSRPADMEMARQWAVNTGVSDGTNPHGALSRQQLVTMLYRFAKSQGKNVTASVNLGSFKDSGAVAAYAKDAFSWAVAKGIVGGDSTGRLNPENTATRAHFAVLLYRYNNG